MAAPKKRKTAKDEHVALCRKLVKLSGEALHERVTHNLRRCYLPIRTKLPDITFSGWLSDMLAEEFNGRETRYLFLKDLETDSMYLDRHELLLEVPVAQVIQYLRGIIDSIPKNTVFVYSDGSWTVARLADTPTPVLQKLHQAWTEQAERKQREANRGEDSALEAAITAVGGAQVATRILEHAARLPRKK